jgi:hypothetical protein
MSTTGINTSFNTLRYVTNRLADMQASALTTAIENISSEDFNKLDQDVIQVTNCKFLLESIIKSKWEELDGDRLTSSIEHSTARLHQLEQYFNYSPEEDQFELKSSLFTVTNDLYELKRKLHILEHQNTDFDLPTEVTTLLLRFKFINTDN